MLLDLARLNHMRRFVSRSSISVYGDVGAAAITEDTPLRPTSVYGATKVACEQLIRGFAAEYGLEGVSLLQPGYTARIGAPIAISVR